MASDDGSYSNRPADAAPTSPVPIVDPDSLAWKITRRRDPWNVILIIGVLHVLFGTASVLFFPLICFGVWFVTLSNSPLSGADESQFREYYFVATTFWLYVALNAILTASLPLGIGIILGRRWGFRGTYVAGFLVASILGSLCVIAVWGFQYFDSGGFHSTFFVVPSTLYLVSTLCLWFLTRRRF